MKNKKIVLTSMVALVGLLFTATAAYTEDVINVTVTAQNISIAVENGESVAYGTLALDSSKSTIDLGVPTITVTNDGNMQEDFDIKSSNSTNWTLSGVDNGTDIYTHEFSTSTGSSWNYMTTDYATMSSNMSPTASSTLDLRITTPATTEYFTQQTISVTILATLAN